jgi:hypothetical protein
LKASFLSPDRLNDITQVRVSWSQLQSLYGVTKGKIVFPRVGTLTILGPSLSCTRDNSDEQNDYIVWSILYRHIPLCHTIEWYLNYHEDNGKRLPSKQSVYDPRRIHNGCIPITIPIPLSLESLLLRSNSHLKFCGQLPSTCITCNKLCYPMMCYAIDCKANNEHSSLLSSNSGRGQCRACVASQSSSSQYITCNSCNRTFHRRFSQGLTSAFRYSSIHPASRLCCFCYDRRCWACDDANGRCILSRCKSCNTQICFSCTVPNGTGWCRSCNNCYYLDMIPNNGHCTSCED